MKLLENSLRAKANETAFSGVVEVETEAESFQAAWGWRDRVNALPNTTSTRFAIASGTKGFTALGAMTLIEAGKLTLQTTAASILGRVFPELDERMTMEHLLAHTSGVGDHFDEEEIQDSVDEYLLSIPVQDLVSPFDYLPLLKEKPQKFPPGEKACYSNGGYVLLAMIIEQVSGQSFHDYLAEQVFQKAGMKRSGFFRSDSLPENTALGYLGSKHDLKTNLFTLPVIGSGDGGAYSTLDDMKSFWRHLLSYQIISQQALSPMIRMQNQIEDEFYGQGFWIVDQGRLIALEGYDAGVSFHSSTSLDEKIRFTVISNDRLGAWPLVELIQKSLLSGSK